MNVQCTHCSTVFRVDPRKVPAGGVRVRCSICRGVFEITGSGTAEPQPSTSAPAAAAPAAPAAPSTPAPQPTPEPVAAAPAPPPAPAATPTPAPAPAAAAPTPPPAPTPTPAPAARPAPAPATSAPRSPFGAADPNAKARRLARALVSDIVTYHPERRDKALADGTLKKEFMDEIKKSWEEYVGQVGAESARSTPHFRDALNEILAKGQQIF
jgi:predicted Zn finger-like uncharacterized protein